MVPMPLSLLPKDIRAEGKRLGYSGDELEEFFAIVTNCDDHNLHLKMQRLERETRRAARDAANRR